MKRVLATLAAAVLASPAPAQSLEALRRRAEGALSRALPSAVHPDLQKPMNPILRAPLDPRNPVETPGGVVARASLPAIIERNRYILKRTFGSRLLDLGVASDAAFSSYFLTFSDAKTTTLAPLGDLNRLRGAGVDARIDANTVYNFRVQVNIFNPVRGSTLKMTPVQGTRGPQNDVKTGPVLDAIQARALVFKARGRELWLFYGTDAKPDASGFADTRSFLFIMEEGLSSKVWPLAEAKLPLGSNAVVDLDGLELNLTRTAGDELIIRE
ncbi:MAG: hypothetical protein HY403_00175 [Elusimicrobia bacterium]|nr:hypothetical protein [Elusimicrobiota bacterium]